MPDRAEIIRQATLKARKNFERFDKKQEKEILSIFRNAISNVEIEITGFARKGKIPPTRLNILLNNITIEVKKIRPKIANKIRAGMRESISLGMESGYYAFNAVINKSDLKIKPGIGTSYIGRDGKIRRFDARLERYSESSWATINEEAFESLIRFRPAGLTLSDQIWRITLDAEQNIRRQVTAGVLQGKGPLKLARELTPFFVDPLKPGRGVYSSAYKNAVRLARTEYARAYNEGTIRYANQKTWIDGYISHTTSANPAPYDKSVDGKFFPKESPPNIPYHPNCMCYAEPHYVQDDRPSMATFINRSNQLPQTVKNI